MGPGLAVVLVVRLLCNTEVEADGNRHMKICNKNQYMYLKFTRLNSNHILSITANRIGGIMVSVLASSAVDRGFKPQSGQTKDYEIGICCFSATHATLRRTSRDWLAQNQNSVS